MTRNRWPQYYSAAFVHDGLSTVFSSESVYVCSKILERILKPHAQGTMWIFDSCWSSPALLCRLPNRRTPRQRKRQADKKRSHSLILEEAARYRRPHDPPGGFVPRRASNAAAEATRVRWRIISISPPVYNRAIGPLIQARAAWARLWPFVCGDLLFRTARGRGGGCREWTESEKPMLYERIGDRARTRHPYRNENDDEC